jgi:hypothetical protein
MIKEAYCSYELSKLLKEKGFDESSFAYYSEFDDWKILRFWRKYARNPINTFYLCAPTHQMACAWLREVHNMHIDIDPSEGDWHPCVIELETWSAISDGNLKICDTYEDAVEAALKYTLENLI